MLNKITKICYHLRLILFILQFPFVFASLYCIMSLSYMKYIFLTIYFIYSIIMILELLSKKEKYRMDLICNIMHIGVTFYLMILAFRINYSKIYVTNFTLNYFNINYGVISILIVFILTYTFFELRNE